MPRLFVALDLPADIKKSLTPLARGLGDVRWTSPDQQHVTLRFIGEIDNGRANATFPSRSTYPARGWRG
jgi:2'-5' RNA ligase